MNALQRDLKKLVPLVESLGKETVAADPHRQRVHPGVCQKPLILET